MHAYLAASTTPRDGSWSQPALQPVAPSVLQPLV